MIERGMSDTIRDITAFTGAHRFLSNFYPAVVEYEGMRFATVEHAYQAAKFNDRKSRRIIQEQPTPGAAKRAGRRIGDIRTDWNAVKNGIMRELVNVKFENGVLRHKLVETLPATLIEGNTWHDNYWGWCFCRECSALPHRNMLGVILTEVRSAAISEWRPE